MAETSDEGKRAVSELNGSIPHLDPTGLDNGSMIRSRIGSAGLGPPLVTQAYEALRDEITDGVLDVGTPLIEGEVAERLGMSKTPVHQALQILEQQGLADRHGPRTLTVAKLTKARYDEILAIRLALEEIAVDRACQSMVDEGFDYLRLRLLQQERAAAREDAHLFLDLDEDFHLGIAWGAGARMVARQIANIGGCVRLMRSGVPMNQAYYEVAIRHHRMLVDAIEAGDSENAIQVLRTQLETNLVPPGEV